MRAGTKKWDKAILAVLVGAGPLVLFIVAGLDFRRHGSRFGPAAIVAGLAVALIGLAVTAMAMHANRFFSTTVRIQTERGHAVVSSGPYAIVRHPGYVGMFLSYAAMPFAIGSAWALWPTMPLLVLLLVRTGLEDRTLRAELPGYAEYAARIRYRLLPGLW